MTLLGSPVRATASAAFLALAIGLPALAQIPIVGVLEQPPQCQDAPAVGVRPLFAKKSGRWEALTTPAALRAASPPQVDFTLAFRGRKLGILHTQDAGFQGTEAWMFRRDHLLGIAQGQALPRLPNPEKRFGGWCASPDLRPVVAIAHGRYVDPAKWKSFRPARGQADSLFASFRTVVDSAFICRTVADSPVPYRYTARDINVEAAYRDGRGRELIALRLDNHGQECDGPTEKDGWLHWFLLSRTPRYLGDQMELLDAGDYDGDGRSELIFWYSGYDRDGYILMSDDVAPLTRFMWNYH